MINCYKQVNVIAKFSVHFVDIPMPQQLQGLLGQ